MELSSYIEGH